MFAFQDARGDVEVAFTDRHGGISGGPFASLNLAGQRPPDGSAGPPGAGAGGDDLAAVAENRARVMSAFTSRPDENSASAAPVLAMMSQVHGAQVALVGADRPEEPPVADALVTRTPGVVLMVRVADCVPVLLADPAARVVGAVHAGRPGLAAGVVPAAVARLREAGAEALTAWVGPHVCGACYEVPDELRAEVSRRVPQAYAVTSWGTPALDIGAGVQAQLEAEGVEVLTTGACTREDEDLFSYRRQGARSGRLAGLVWVRP